MEGLIIHADANARLRLADFLGSEKADLSDDEPLTMKRLFRKVHERLAEKHGKASVDRHLVDRSFTDQERAVIRAGNSALSAYLDQDLARCGYPVTDAGDERPNRDRPGDKLDIVLRQETPQVA